jgi:PIN domain nuclease of toxin-antitoxin system
VKVLLDTHALLWWLFEPNKLPSRVVETLNKDDTEVWVSAASIMEIATKFRIGKLAYAASIVSDFDGMINANGFKALPISIAHAALAGTITVQNKDPFDRFLLAQALSDGFTLISNETVFDSTGVTRLWK